ASRPPVPASAFIMQPPVKTSAVRASTYTPFSATPLAVSTGDIASATNAASSVYFFISTPPSGRAGPYGSSSEVSLPSELAASSPVLAHIRAHWLAIRAECGLRRTAPVGGAIHMIVKRRFVRVHYRVHVHALRAELQAVHADDDFR